MKSRSLAPRNDGEEHYASALAISTIANKMSAAEQPKKTASHRDANIPERKTRPGLAQIRHRTAELPIAFLRTPPYLLRSAIAARNMSCRPALAAHNKVISTLRATGGR